VLASVPAAVEDLKGLPEEEALERAVAADAILLGARFRFDAARLARLQRCRAIVRYGVGVDNVDLPAARSRGIVVSCVPDYCVDEVATHAIALLLAIHRQLGPYAERARAGRLGIDSDHPIPRLGTLVLGVVGFGRIGRETAARARALGMRILAYDPFLDDATVVRAGAEPATLDRLLAEADAVTLHVPLDDTTRNLLDADRLARMKPGAIVVNVGRGGLIDEAALAAALASGRLGGAGLDVTTTEPLPAGHPLYSTPNTIVTAHVAWYSTGAQRDLQLKAAEEVARILKGEPPRSAVD
jgi:D-3-phosphoglycerate dehydrogenase / 2-oxoglutarate reductase